MRLRKAGKWAMAVAAVTVYVTVPAYRYWVIGSWVAYKIMNDKHQPRYRVIPKSSPVYKRIIGVM